MARLLEFQAKALLREAGISIPRGEVVRSAAEASAAAKRLGGAVVMKIQAHTTGRKALGGVVFPKTPEEAGAEAARLLAMKVGHFPVREVLVEEKLPISKELFLSIAIDDRTRAPVMLIGASGGTGIEERAAEIGRVPCSVSRGVDRKALEAKLGAGHAAIDAAVRAFELAKRIEARSVEINPLAILSDGRIVALDGRVTVDDYSVFRHPELGIEMARELDHPPTALEMVAYRVEQEDHRGTFFFAQMNVTAAAGSKGLVGFHGAGGGGSMMSMDAVTTEGFTVANFTDTSGNPSAAKVYRAARIILNQPGLCGYFGSGSGVASQEQFWSAYGLAKAFWEMDIDIPVVVRLGGNTEDRAVAILHDAGKLAKAPIEGYRKSDTPAKIAARFAELVAKCKAQWKPRRPRRPAFVGAGGAPGTGGAVAGGGAAAMFPIRGGRVWVDRAAWKRNAHAIVSRSAGLLRDSGGEPKITVTPEEFATKDSELIACEVECRHGGVDGLFVELDIPGVEEIA